MLSLEPAAASGDLFADIPEEGPRIFSLACINVAGFFVGGPVLKVPGWIWWIGWDDDDEGDKNTATLEALAIEAAIEKREKEKADRKIAQKAAQKAALELARAEYRAMKAAA